MKIKKLNYNIGKKLIHTFSKNGYEYNIYADQDKITINKQDIKSEKFEIQSFEIV
jgi:phenolic acid decarboxylase